MGRFGLGLEVLQTRPIGAIDISVFRLEITVDTKPLNPLPYAIHAKAICLGVMLGGLETERFDQMSIDEGMLGGDFGSGAPGDLATNAAGFQQRYRSTRISEQIGGSNANDSRADDDHVKVLRACQSRICRFGRCRRPAAIRLAAKPG